MNKKIVSTLIALIIIIAFVIIISSSLKHSPSLPPTEQATSTVEATGTTYSVEQATSSEQSVTVRLTDSGYVPASVTINAGDTVTFVNDSSGKMWTASGPHPVHTDYPGFDEKAAANNGESYSFTFTKVGTWHYHNHLNPSVQGTVVVNAVSNKD